MEASLEGVDRDGDGAINGTGRARNAGRRRESMESSDGSVVGRI